MTSSAGPLRGLKVIDLTNSYAGPTASMYLADLGATVVKVERPGAGDDCRGWGPPFWQDTSAWFASANRNKSSIVLNLRVQEGRDILGRLVDSADIFIQNLNPAKLTALGIDEATLRRRNPRLIYCALSGFGLNGPDRNLAGYDLVAQARSGIMSVTGEKGGQPQRVSTALSDIATGMCAVMAISAAAVQQARTGEGDSIDVSLLDTDLALMAPRIAAYHAGDPEPAPSGGTDSVLAVYHPFEAADRTIVIAIGNDQMWQRFCVAIGLEDLAADPELADNVGRRTHRDRIAKRIAAVLSEQTAAHWQQVLGDAGVPTSLVQSLSEVLRDPQVVARRTLVPVPESDGNLITVRSPFRLASMPGPRNERFPQPGEHTRETLGTLGFTTGQIDQLIERGIVGSPQAADPSAASANGSQARRGTVVSGRNSTAKDAG